MYGHFVSFFSNSLISPFISNSQLNRTRLNHPHEARQGGSLAIGDSRDLTEGAADSNDPQRAVRRSHPAQPTAGFGRLILPTQRLVSNLGTVDGCLIALEYGLLPVLAGIEDCLASAAANSLQLIQRVGELRVAA